MQPAMSLSLFLSLSRAVISVRGPVCACACGCCCCCCCSVWRSGESLFFFSVHFGLFLHNKRLILMKVLYLLRIQNLVQVQLHLHSVNVSNYCFCRSVAALNKIIDFWNLRSKLNPTIDPCAQNASWTSENANPRVACDCSGNICHITHL